MDLYDTGKKDNGPKTALLKVMDLYDTERKGNGPMVHFALLLITHIPMILTSYLFFDIDIYRLQLKHSICLYWLFNLLK